MNPKILLIGITTIVSSSHASDLVVYLKDKHYVINAYVNEVSHDQYHLILLKDTTSEVDLKLTLTNFKMNKLHKDKFLKFCIKIDQPCSYICSGTVQSYLGPVDIGYDPTQWENSIKQTKSCQDGAK